MQGCHESGRFWVHYAELVFHDRGVPLELWDLRREFIGEGTQTHWPEPMCTISSAQGTGFFLRWGPMQRGHLNGS